MTPSDLQLLKASIDSVVELAFTDGTRQVARVISVFDEESDPDVFYTAITFDGKVAGDFGVQLSEIASVTTVQTPP